MPIVAAAGDPALLILEIGIVVLALGFLARVAHRFELSPIPLYLLAGLVLGNGGLADLELSEQFIETASEIGVVLLLLTLGLEYSPNELQSGLRAGWRVGVVDLVANFPPGLVAGLLLGWDLEAALLLGGVTYISSSGIIAKVLSDLGRLGNRETPAVLSVLVIEDLVMAAYLPVMGVVLAGSGLVVGAASVAVALATVSVVLFVALRHGATVSRLLFTRSDEALLLTVLGLTLVVAAAADRLDVSAAVGAFLVGIALSGPVQRRARTLIGPLRDLFAATFFLFFTLQVDPASLPDALLVGATLALVTGLTKYATGVWAAARIGAGPRGRRRAGTALIARGEFSIVIAGLGVGIEPELGTLATAYVLILAIAGPVLTRYADSLGRAGARATPM